MRKARRVAKLGVRQNRKPAKLTVSSAWFPLDTSPKKAPSQNHKPIWKMWKWRIEVSNRRPKSPGSRSVPKNGRRVLHFTWLGLLRRTGSPSLDRLHHHHGREGLWTWTIRCKACTSSVDSPARRLLTVVKGGGSNPCHIPCFIADPFPPK